MSLGIEFATAKRSQYLNYSYRGIDKPTNVLAFPGHYEFNYLGDLCISPAILIMECTPDQLSLYYKRIIIHGLLHLLGYDHQYELEAELMLFMENKILASM